MNKVLRVLFLVLIMVGLSSCSVQKTDEDTDLLKAIKSRQEFVVGINENSRPFGYLDDEGNITGFDAELIKEISKIIFNTDKIVKFEKITPSNRIYKLNLKQIDAIISTMTINHERLLVVNFSNPYFMTGQALLVKKDSPYKTGKDLDYKKIGIVLGTTAADNIRYIASHAKIVGFKNYEEAFDKLINGKLDAISTDDVILQGLIDENPDYRLLPDRYSTEFYGIAFRKDEKSKSLQEAVNKALAELEQTGKLKKLEQKYNVNYRR